MQQREQRTVEEQGGHVHLWSLQQSFKADQCVVDSAKEIEAIKTQHAGATLDACTQAFIEQYWGYIASPERKQNAYTHSKRHRVCI